MPYGVCHPSGAAQHAMEAGLVKPMRLVPSRVVPVGEVMVFSDETLIPVLDTIDRLLDQREHSHFGGHGPRHEKTNTASVLGDPGSFASRSTQIE